MGFPIGYSVGIVGFLPRLFLNSVSVLDFIRSLILTLLRPLGLSGFLEPGPVRANRAESSGSDRPESVPVWLVREMLPAAKFSEVAGAGEAETPESCAVCLYSFHGDEEIRRLRNCKHVFHKGCLDRWMDHDRMTCPLCRTPLVSPEEMQEAVRERPWADVYGVAEYLPIPNFF